MASTRHTPVHITRTSTVTEFFCHRCGQWFAPRVKPTPTGRQGFCGKCKTDCWYYPRVRTRRTAAATPTAAQL